MTVINTSILALGAQDILSVVNNEIEKAMARLSSGLRFPRETTQLTKSANSNSGGDKHVGSGQSVKAVSL